MKKLLRVSIGSLLTVVLFFSLRWTQRMLVTGLNPFLGYLFILLLLLLVLPFVIRGIRRLAEGRAFTPAMLFAVGLISWLLSSVFIGFLAGIQNFSIMVKDTYYVMAYGMLMRGIALVFGIFCVLYHFNPRMNNMLAYIHFWLTFIAVYFIFWPMSYGAIVENSSRYVYYSEHYFTPQRFGGLNRFTLIMSIAFLAAQALFLFNFFSSLVKKRTAVT